MQYTAIKYFILAFALSLIIVLFNLFSATGKIYGFWHGIKILFWLTIGPETGDECRAGILPDGGPPDPAGDR